MSNAQVGWSLGALVVGALVIAAGTPTPKQLSEAQARQGAEEAKMARALVLLPNVCKKAVDAAGLFDEEFRAIVGKGYVTRKAPRDLVAWDCPNGTRYWAINSTVPDGFLRDYAADIQPTLVTK